MFVNNKNKSVMIGVLARDVENNLPMLLYNLSVLEQYFDNFDIVFFENDSIDRTKEILENFCSAKDNRKLISKTLNRKKYGSVINTERVERLAEYRNTIVQEFVSGEKEILIFIESDLVFFEPIDVVYLINNKVEWDIISVMGVDKSSPLNESLILENRGKYYFYDSWGTRDINGNQFSGLPPFSEDKETSLGIFNRETIKVKSTFSGVCAYKRHIFENDKVRFYGYDCDVVTICLEAAKMGFDKIYMDCNIKVYYGMVK